MYKEHIFSFNTMYANFPRSFANKQSRILASSFFVDGNALSDFLSYIMIDQDLRKSMKSDLDDARLIAVRAASSMYVSKCLCTEPLELVFKSGMMDLLRDADLSDDELKSMDLRIDDMYKVFDLKEEDHLNRIIVFDEFLTDVIYFCMINCKIPGVVKQFAPLIRQQEKLNERR